MTKSKVKAVFPHIDLVDYDQGGSVYDSPVFLVQPSVTTKSGSRASSQGQREAVFNGSVDLEVTTKGKTKKEKEVWSSVWEVAQGSLESAQEALAGSITGSMKEKTPKLSAQSFLAGRDVQSAALAIKQGKNKSRLPESLAAKARAARSNPRIQAQKPRRSLSPDKKRRSESPTKQRHSSPSKRQLQPQAHASSRKATVSPPRAKKSPRSPSQGRNRAEPPARSTSAHRSPKRDGRQPSPTRDRGRSSTNRCMEPEEGSIIQIRKKEQAAKKRAARAKKKGAKKKSSSSSKPKPEQDNAAPSSPGKNPVPVPVICVAPNRNPNGAGNGGYPEDGTAGVSLITDPGAHAFNDMMNGPQATPGVGSGPQTVPAPADGSAPAHAAGSPPPPVPGVNHVWSEQPPNHAANPVPQPVPKVSAAAAWSAAPIWSAPTPGRLSPDQPAPARSSQSQEPSPVVWSAPNPSQQGSVTGVTGVWSITQRGAEAMRTSWMEGSDGRTGTSQHSHNYNMPDYNNGSGASMKMPPYANMPSYPDGGPGAPKSSTSDAKMPPYASMPSYPDGGLGAPKSSTSDANIANMPAYDNGATVMKGGSTKNASWVEAADKPHGSLPPYPESRAASSTKKKAWDASDDNAQNASTPPHPENQIGVSMKKSWVEVDATSALPGFPETRSAVSALKKSWVDVEESDMSAVMGAPQGSSFQLSIDPSTRATLAAASSRVSVARSTHSRRSFDCGHSRASVGQSTISAGMSTVSGPAARRMPADAPGVRRDPPGVARKVPNDDASVAIKPTLIPGQKPQRVLKSIVRPDLEIFKQPPPPPPSRWESLLTGVARCGGADTSEPDPVRPCDIPRGSERRIDLSKAAEGNGSKGVTGEFLNSWFT